MKDARSLSPPATPSTRATSPTQLAAAVDPCSPPAAPHRAQRGPLLKAMLANSVEQARAALREDPGSAFEPLFDFGVEPPLCAAVRIGAREEIVEMLLDHGADPTSVDVQGHEALHLLTKRTQNVPWDEEPPDYNQVTSMDVYRAMRVEYDNAWDQRSRQYEAEVAAMLMARGASVHTTQVRGGAGTSCLRIAQRMGKDYLVRLYRGDVVPAAAM